MASFHDLKVLQRFDPQLLTRQRVLTLVVHYHSTVEQALDLVRQAETSVPLGDLFRDSKLVAMFGAVASLGAFRFALHHFDDASVQLVHKCLTNIQRLELVIMSSEMFSNHQANCLTQLFANGWAAKIKSLKVWVKAGLGEVEHANRTVKQNNIEVAIFGSIKTDKFSSLEQLTLELWDFVPKQEPQKLFPSALRDVIRPDFGSLLNSGTIKQFSFGSRNNCTTVWHKVMQNECMQNKSLDRLLVAVPFGRFATERSKDENIDTMLAKMSKSKFADQFQMVGLVLCKPGQLQKALAVFQALTRLTVQLSKDLMTSAKLNESDVVIAIAASKCKLVDLRIFTEQPMGNTPFGSKKTDVSLVDVLSLTLGTFGSDLFGQQETQPQQPTASPPSATDKQADHHKLLNLALIKQIVPKCRALVLRLSDPYFVCATCNSQREHYSRVLRNARVPLAFSGGVDAVRLDFATFSADPKWTQASMIFTEYQFDEQGAEIMNVTGAPRGRAKRGVRRGVKRGAPANQTPGRGRGVQLQAQRVPGRGGQNRAVQSNQANSAQSNRAQGGQRSAQAQSNNTKSALSTKQTQAGKGVPKRSPGSGPSPNQRSPAAKRTQNQTNRSPQAKTQPKQPNLQPTVGGNKKQKNQQKGATPNNNNNKSPIGGGATKSPAAKGKQPGTPPSTKTTGTNAANKPNTSGQPSPKGNRKK